ncbi:MAG TPA: leucyl aminopeptidase [Candidatus Paceibacterota bacterium]
MLFTIIRESKNTPVPEGTLVQFRFDMNPPALIPSAGGLTLFIGIGKKEEITRRKLALLARKVIQIAKQHRLKGIAIRLDDFHFPKTRSVSDKELAELIAQNFVLANFEFNVLKSAPPEGFPSTEEVTVLVTKDPSPIRKGLERGQLIGEEVNKCRILANTPGGDMTPKRLAEAAKEAAKGTKVDVTVLGQNALENLKMGAILGVARGSNEEPQFIIMEYWGAGKNGSKPLVLCGKGVTFDSGGLNVKPGDSMYEMHMDMSGGASVIHAVILAAKLGLKKNVVGLIPAVENMPSGSSYHPGDVLRSLSGKTIEVLNTDAEGRVILADALTYAKQYKPKLVVDVATLTGAALVALGQHAHAILTRDKKLEKLFQELGEEAGEYVWPLPLWDEYEEYIKGTFGDVSNIASSGNSRYGGVINGAMFLYQFTKNDPPANGQAYPWVHIDMAPRMTSTPSDNLAKGATGEPVRLLLKLIEKF